MNSTPLLGRDILGHMERGNHGFIFNLINANIYKATLGVKKAKIITIFKDIVARL